MDNFDCTKMNAQFEKFTACLREGLIHEWKQTLPVPSLPLMSLNNLQLCSAIFLLPWVTQCSTNDKLCILVKAQPCTRSTWLQSPTRLGIRPRDLDLLNKYSLGHCGFSAASRHKLAFTSRHYALLTASDTTALY